MITYGVHISDTVLLPYSQLLSNWITCIQDYIDIWDGNDLPYWYNERANVGVLAGAAWKSGMTALEEFQTEKVANDGENSKGRNDLYVANKSIGAYIEAKVIFPDISKHIKYQIDIKNKLKLALNDVRRVKDMTQENEKIAALFVAPYSIKNRASDKEIKKFIDTLSTYSIEDINIGAFAWCCANKAQKTLSHDKKYYPIVAVLFCRA